MNEMENLSTQIEERINKLTIEQGNLQHQHDGMVKHNYLMNQEFQQRVIKNQTRFAQIAGAIEELSKLRNGETQPQEKQTP